MPGRSRKKRTSSGNAEAGVNGAGTDPALRDRAALAAALDPIITIDARGIIQSASDSVTRVLGWAPADLIGNNVSVLMPEPHRSAHDGYLARYHETGKTNIMNRPRRFEARRKDGTRIPIELCVSRANAPGSPLFVGIIRDMSEYAAAERTQEEERSRSQELLAEQTTALQTAHLRLRMADRMASIGTLAAGLGHDMNNVLLPVRARLNALRAAADGGTMPAGERRHVEEIRKSVAYLQQLADGLHFLALDPDTEEARGGGGESTDLQEWWSQVGALISKAVPRHVRVSASIPVGLARVAVAPHRLTQAVLNLVVNAGEAIPTPATRKRRQGNVRIRAQECRLVKGTGVRIGVTDNGTGMSEDVKRRAFEMFFTTKPRGLGTGLGLALVRRVAEHAGGTVEVQSEVGKGTSIVVTLPVAAAGNGEDGMAGRVAVVTLKDGRAAALVGHMLSTSGYSVQSEPTPGARIWVADPGVVRAEAARRWVKGNAARRVVVFGVPTGSEGGRWRTISAFIISKPDDLGEIRAVMGRVLAES